MFKAKVYFKTGNMEYMLVGGFDENQATDTITEEFCAYEIKSIELERVSDAPGLVVVSIDAYDAIEVE